MTETNSILPSTPTPPPITEAQIPDFVDSVRPKGYWLAEPFFPIADGISAVLDSANAAGSPGEGDISDTTNVKQALAFYDQYSVEQLADNPERFAFSGVVTIRLAIPDSGGKLLTISTKTGNALVVTRASYQGHAKFEDMTLTRRNDVLVFVDPT